MTATAHEDQKLLPCPFCGAEMNISEQGNLGHPQGECVVVAILIAYHSGFIPEKSKLIDLWNRRAKS